MKQLNCFVMGDGPLTKFCLQYLIEAGHNIQCVITCNAELRQWLQGIKIPYESADLVAQRLTGNKIPLLFIVDSDYSSEIPDCVAIEHCISLPSLQTNYTSIEDGFIEIVNSLARGEPLNLPHHISPTDQVTAAVYWHAILKRLNQWHIDFLRLNTSQLPQECPENQAISLYSEATEEKCCGAFLSYLLEVSENDQISLELQVHSPAGETRAVPMVCSAETTNTIGEFLQHVHTTITLITTFADFPTEKADWSERLPLVLSFSKDFSYDEDRPQALQVHIGTDATKLLKLSVYYHPAYYHRKRIGELLDNFSSYLAIAMKNPDLQRERLPLVSSMHQRILVNNPLNIANEKVWLVSLIQAQVQKNPHKLAIIDKGHSLTYEELDRLSDKVAHYLRNAGLARGAIIAVVHERSFAYVPLIVGIMKAGMVFLPLAPDASTARTRAILQHAQVDLIIVDNDPRQENVCMGFSWLRLNSIILSEINQGEFAFSHHDPNDLAYIIYTSGSTGSPKGVMISHRSLSNLAQSFAKGFNISHSDRVLQFSDYSFDASLAEITGALIAGATLIIRTQIMITSSATFFAECQRLAISVLNLPSAFWAQLVQDLATTSLRLPPTIKTVLIGGEAVTPARIEQWYNNVGSEIRLFNTYGPTETTIAVTAGDLGAYPLLRSQASLIGTSFAHASLYVLDRHRRLLPLGAIGELYVGGPGVGQGYFKRPDLTVERFLPSLPFVDNSIGESGPFYMTGDRVQWLDQDNHIETTSSHGTENDNKVLAFIGRADRQIKIRGFRVELGEIERVLASFPGVLDSHVIYHKEQEPARLIAFLLYHTSHAINLAELRAYLEGHLPRYMQPGHIQCLEKWPVTNHGKIDQRLLLSQLTSSTSHHIFTDEVDVQLADLWRKLLTIRHVDHASNFFHLGGHSLLAMRLSALLSKVFRISLTFRQILENPSFHRMATLIRETKQQKSSQQQYLTPSSSIPLSFAQEALWLIDQRHHGRSINYNIAFAIHIKGLLNNDALEKSLNFVLERQATLRTVFQGDIHNPVQATINKTIRLSPEAIALAQFPSIALSEARTPFKLAEEAPLRIRLFSIGAEYQVLLINHHHIIHDGYSIGVLMRELSLCYKAFCAHRLPVLAQLPLTYAIHACRQREAPGIDRDDSLDYWRKQLSGYRPLLLPFRKPQGRMNHESGRTYCFSLDGEVLRSLRRLISEKDCTLFVGLITLLAMLFNRYSPDEDMAFASVISTRDHHEHEHLIGMFLNVVILRIRINPLDSFSSLLQHVKKVLLDATTHHSTPLERIAQLTPMMRVPNDHSLFDIMIGFHNLDQNFAQFESAELSCDTEFINNQSAKYGMSFDIYDLGTSLDVKIEYCTDLYDDLAIEQIATHYRNMIASLLRIGDQALSSYHYLSPREKSYTLSQFPSEGIGPATTVNAMFAASVQKYGARIAIDNGDRCWSYHELNDDIEILCGRLKKIYAMQHDSPYSPQTCIAVCVDRQPALLIALLAIMRLGCAFVPTDPKHPMQRTTFMIQDCDARVIITEKKHLSSFHAIEIKIPVLCIDDLEYGDNNDEAAKIDTTIPSDLAYVMYTSGTTGQPKGVMIEHGSLCHYIRWTAQQLQLDDDVNGSNRFDFSTNIIFDATITTTIVPLCLGKTVVICKEADRASPKSYVNFLAHAKIELLKITPSYFSLLVRMIGVDLIPLPHLRQLLLTGEAVNLADIKKWIEHYPQTAIYNSYGPTEATVTVSKFKVDATNVNGFTQHIPIEMNSRIGGFYIIDKNLHLVADGVPGDLYLAGPTLARGYLNRPELNAQSFMEYRHSPNCISQRLYKTGDVCVRQSDGAVYFLGRKDNQVKLRGHRIELDEITAALNSHPDILISIVIFDNSLENPRIIAYFVPTNSAADSYNLSSSQLRDYCMRHLPYYMVPNYFIALEQMPFTSTGKLDKASLPDWRTAIHEPHLQSKPTNPIEEIVLDIWQQILGIDAISTCDSFFSVGGHSLAAMKICYAITQRCEVEVSYAEFYEQDCIRKLGALIAAKSASHNAVFAKGIFPINTQGDRTPLFLIHPGSGLALPYLKLKHYIPDQPMYGISNPYFGEFPAAFRSLQEMAAFYGTLIEQTYPRGPLILGGWSFGGVVAFEMAQQLTQQGRKVKSVLLIDSFLLSHNIEATHDSAQHRSFVKYLGLDPDTPLGGKFLHELANNSKLSAAYQSKKYPHQAVLIRANNGQGLDPKYQRLDPFNGWLPVINMQEFSLVEMEAEHFSLFDAENLPVISQLISSCIAQQGG